MSKGYGTAGRPMLMKRRLFISMNYWFGVVYNKDGSIGQDIPNCQVEKASEIHREVP